MTRKPRPISGNEPFDAIAKDYNRYCGRIVGNEVPGGIAVTNIFNDSNIVVTFSEAVQPTTVTNVGDGTGSFELYNDTQAAWVAGVLSTLDNIQWTFNPDADFLVNDNLTLFLADTILTAVGSNPYEGPFEIKYKVVAQPLLSPPIDSVITSGGDTLTITFDPTGFDTVNLYYSQSSPVTTGDTKVSAITSPYDLTGLNIGEGYYLALEGVLGAVPYLLGDENEGWVNEMLSSEDFTTNWVITDMVVTGNIFTAPDGTNTADKMDDNTASVGNFKQGFTLGVGDESQQRTISIYFKEETSPQSTIDSYYTTNGTTVVLRFVVDWAAGVPTLNAGLSTTYGDATIINEGNGWYRLTASLTNNNTGNTEFLMRGYPAEQGAGANTGSVQAWGAQVVKGNIAGKYTKRLT